MKEKKEQESSWKTNGHADLRDLDSSQKLPAVEILETKDSEENALLILEFHLGFLDSQTVELTISTPVDTVLIVRENLPHIVEKRQHARERYTKHALETMKDPFEVWLVAYEDVQGNVEHRYAYIGAFEGKHQMLVVFSNNNGRVLWNFMQSDAKSLNKHRHGKLIYCRPQKAKAS